MSSRYYLTHRGLDTQFFSQIDTTKWDVAMGNTRLNGLVQPATMMAQTKNGGGFSINRSGSSYNTPVGSYSNLDVMLSRFVSPSLDAQTINGTFDIGIASEASEPGGPSTWWRIHIWQARYNATLDYWENVFDLLDLTETSTQYLERRALSAPATLSSATILSDDRLVVDIGFRINGSVSSGGYHLAIWKGTYTNTSPSPAGTIGADVIVGDPSDFATQASWIEFSDTIVESTDYAAPANDACVDAEVIPAAVASLPYITGPVRGSTSADTANRLWWKWTPDVDCDVLISVFGSMGEVSFDVKSATTCNSGVAAGMSGGTFVANCSSRPWLGLAQASDWWHAVAGVTYTILVTSGSGNAPGSTGAQALRRGSVVYLQLRKRLTPQIGDVLLNVQNQLVIRDGEIINIGRDWYDNTPTGISIDRTLRPLTDYNSNIDIGERVNTLLFSFDVVEIEKILFNDSDSEISYIDMDDDPVTGSLPVEHPASIIMDNAGDLLVGFFGQNYSHLGLTSAANTITPIKLDSLITIGQPSPPYADVKGVYDVTDENSGSDYIELSKDQTTLFYTSAGRKVLKFDLNTNTQLADFADLAPEVSPGPRPGLRGLRLLPPGDGTGGLLVADGINVKRLNAAGTVVQVYTPAESHLAMDLDKVEITPGANSFYVTDQLSTTMFKFNIATGAQTQTVKLYQAAGQLCGFSPHTAYRASEYAPLSSGIPDPTLDPDYIPPVVTPPVVVVDSSEICCSDKDTTVTEAGGNTSNGADPVIVPLIGTQIECAGGGLVPEQPPIIFSETWWG